MPVKGSSTRGAMAVSLKAWANSGGTPRGKPADPGVPMVPVTVDGFRNPEAWPSSSDAGLWSGSWHGCRTADAWQVTEADASELRPHAGHRPADWREGQVLEMGNLIETMFHDPASKAGGIKKFWRSGVIPNQSDSRRSCKAQLRHVGDLEVSGRLACHGKNVLESPCKLPVPGGDGQVVAALQVQPEFRTRPEVSGET